MYQVDQLQIGGVQRGESIVEKDLGVLVDHKLNNSMQIEQSPFLY